MGNNIPTCFPPSNLLRSRLARKQNNFTYCEKLGEWMLYQPKQITLILLYIEKGKFYGVNMYIINSHIYKYENNFVFLFFSGKQLKYYNFMSPTHNLLLIKKRLYR